MTKSDLVFKLVQRHPYMSAQDADIVLNAIIGEIASAIMQTRKVELRGFGVFGVKLRNARKAKNPKTGEMLNIGERYSVFFKMGKKMQECLNGQDMTEF